MEVGREDSSDEDNEIGSSDKDDKIGSADEDNHNVFYHCLSRNY